MYKDLNGDVGIRFPIKVDIAQNPHKVSLLIQSELGGSVFPSQEKWKKHKTQFNIDKNMVFSHVNRLIRCIVDCQLHMDDAVSVRHSLELARSLAAGVWDNSPFQMKQIDMIGEAGVRKLAQAGINSVETLQNTEPHRIEYVLGRHPPFGQKVLAKAVEFPTLHVSVKQMGKECSPGRWVKIKFKADIGFVNEKIPLVFRKKAVYVCFMAETSDGQLIDFRRFAAKKLENGQEILLSVQLTKPATSINCHIMCDEVAGTSRRAELAFEHFPASYFPTPEPMALQSAVTETKANTAFKGPQDFDDFGDIDDADLLAAFDNEEGIEVVHDIDKLVEDSKALEKKPLKRKASKISATHEADPAPFREPVQLENGRWTCQHYCKEQGKSCKHLCCANGVENPKKPGRKKALKTSTVYQEEEDAAVPHPPAKTSPFEKARLRSEAKKQKSTAASTQKVNNTDSLHRTEPEATSPPPSRIPAHRYEKGKAPELSFMQNPYGLSKINDVGADEDVFAFDVDDVMDVFGDGETFNKGTSNRGISSQRAGPRPENKPAYAPPEQNKKPTRKQVQSDVHSSNGDQMGTPEVKLTAVDTIQSQEPDFYAAELGNEADFGAFDAPLAHITPTATQRWASTPPTRSIVVASAPQEKQKKNFITGETSCPEKSLQKAPEAIFGEEDFGNSAVEAFFAAMEAVDYNPWAKKQKLSPDISAGSSVPSPRTGGQLQTSTARTSPVLGDPEILIRQPLTALQNAPVRQQIAVKPDLVESAGEEVFKTDVERQKQLAEEEQRKKWEGLEDFYEEFGDFVEII